MPRLSMKYRSLVHWRTKSSLRIFTIFLLLKLLFHPTWAKTSTTVKLSRGQLITTTTAPSSALEHHRNDEQHRTKSPQDMVIVIKPTASPQIASMPPSYDDYGPILTVVQPAPPVLIEPSFTSPSEESPVVTKTTTTTEKTPMVIEIVPDYIDSVLFSSPPTIINEVLFHPPHKPKSGPTNHDRTLPPHTIDDDTYKCPSSLSLMNCKCRRFLLDTPSAYQRLSQPATHVNFSPLVIVPHAPPTSWIVKCHAAHLPIPQNQQVGVDSSSLDGFANNDNNLLERVAQTATNLQTNPLYYINRAIPMLPENVFGADARILVPSLTITDSGLYYVKHSAFTPEQTRALRELNFAGNVFRELPYLLLSSTVNLENLNMSHNQIVFVQRGALAALTQLKWLDLSHNRIRSVGNESFSTQRNLILLNLAANHIETLSPSMFTGLEQLRVFIFSRNGLGTAAGGQNLRNVLFPPVLGNLKYLDLSYCNIKRIEAEAFKNLPNLEQLDLAGNLTDEISASAFEGAVALRMLFMQNNRGFRTLPQRLLSPMLLLNVVDFRNGSLETLVPDTFTGARNLMVIDLRNNSLAYLPKNTFSIQELFSLRQIYLGGNRYVCDSRLSWFRQWLMIHENIVQDLENIRCFEPVQMRNVLIGDVTSVIQSQALTKAA